MVLAEAKAYIVNHKESAMTCVTTERFNEAVACWKTLMYCIEVQNYLRIKAMIPKSPLSAMKETTLKLFRWRELEECILDNSLKELPRECWMVPEDQLGKKMRIEALEYFPPELFLWNRESRQIYHLPSDLEFLFATAQPQNVRWQDVMLPFDAFVIELETPLEVEEDLAKKRWAKYDTILVTKTTREDGSYTIQLRLFSDHGGKPFLPFPDKEAKLVERNIRANDLGHAYSALKKGLRKSENSRNTAPGWRSHQIFDSRRISPASYVKLEAEDFLEYYRGNMTELGSSLPDNEIIWRLEIVSTMAKIAVCWAVYLSKVDNPAIERRPMPAPSPGTRGVTGVITTPDYINVVVGKSVLDPVAIPAHADALREMTSTFFKRPHGRRAHFRRPPRSPQNAPKTVKVPAVIVRKDLIPLVGIIGGTLTKVLSEE